MSGQERDGAESTVKQALREIRRLKEELAAERAQRQEPLAIVGMGLRLPGQVDTPESFWQLLAGGVDAVGPIPTDRWAHAAYFDERADVPGKYYVQRGGFLTSVDCFDPEFFGIAPVEAETMDPQQRLLLETVWEALEHGAIPATSLQGTRTGVFVGIGATDYHRLVMADPAADTYASTGTLFSVAAGRLSYVLGLNGPALAIDTACSSSLVAVHLACRSLRAGESDLALAAGVSLMLAPELTVNFCRAGMLSRDGRCKTFDAAADGYVRSEGCGVVVLKRLSDALRDGNRIHALVRGSAINQDGRSSGLTAPSGPAQEAVLRAALRDANVAAQDIDYVEAHGTGTPLGDPIEVQAIDAVFSPGRSHERPLLLGSVKTNLGHLEAAAGIAGLIKVALSLEHGEIPPHLHFEKPNPHINWGALPVVVPTRLTPWQSQGNRLAGVSSFGFSGTNAHVVLESAPAAQQAAGVPLAAPISGQAGTTDLLVLSAPHEDGLRALAQSYVDYLGRTAESFPDICQLTRTGRVHFSERLAVVADDVDSGRRALEAWLKGEASTAVRAGRPASPHSALAFVFTDSDVPDPFKIQMLLQCSSPFAQALEECNAILRASLDVPLLELLSPGGSRNLREPKYALPATFAVQYALAAMWRSMGIQPLAVLGTGTGEYAAAQMAGVFALPDALELVTVRGRSGNEAPDSTVNGAQTEVQRALSTTVFRVPGLRYISGATGSHVDPHVLADKAYWLSQPHAPARVGNAHYALKREGLLQGVEIDGRSGSAFAGRDPWRSVLEVRAALFVRGVNPGERAAGGNAHARRISLPTYPFRRRRFWHGPGSAGVGTDNNIVAGGDGNSAAWTAAAEAAAERAGLVPLEMNISSYGDTWAALNALTETLGRNVLAGLGAFSTAGEARDLDGVLGVTGIRPIYGHIVKRWLDALVRTGQLERTERGYRALAPLRVADAGAIWQRAEQALSSDPPLLAYVRHSASLLTEVLTGRTSALETLFPGGSFELAANLYHNSTLLRYVNGIAGAAAGAFVNELPAGAPVRVLEVGAGTGGTTATLLKVLPPSTSTYLYTDVSEIFLDYAHERFAPASFLRTALFDLEQDPEIQNFGPGEWDLVVAANVVHAARDIRLAVKRLLGLLAPGGLLLLVESTGHHTWHDITTGLIEGWQHFEDDIRTETPLLTPDGWLTLLRDSGFVDARVFPEVSSPGNVLKQNVLIARAPAHVRTAHAQLAAPVRALPAATAAPAAPPAIALEPRKETAPASQLVRDIADAPAGEREELAALAVRECVMSVLRSDTSRPPGRDARLLDLGLDSLMAVRLRNQLQQRLGLADPLPSTLVFDYPTIRQIARLIVKRISGEAGAVKNQKSVDSANEIAGLSDAEVEAMLLSRLEAEESK